MPGFICVVNMSSSEGERSEPDELGPTAFGDRKSQFVDGENTSSKDDFLRQWTLTMRK
jgi:hypothetical protein